MIARIPEHSLIRDKDTRVESLHVPQYLLIIISCIGPLCEWALFYWLEDTSRYWTVSMLKLLVVTGGSETSDWAQQHYQVLLAGSSMAENQGTLMTGMWTVVNTSLKDYSWPLILIRLNVLMKAIYWVQIPAAPDIWTTKRGVDSSTGFVSVFR